MKNIMPNICFIDFETTGIDVYNDEPIELGAVVVDNEFEIINQFYSRIKLPDNKIVNHNSFKIHGISTNDLEFSPSQNQVLQDFFRLLGNDFCFAAWNISFDIGFFKKVCNNNDMTDRFNTINYRHIDVQTISQIASRLGLFSKNIRSFSDCVDYFDLSRKELHNAYEDAKLCSLVYSKLLDLIKKG